MSSGTPVQYEQTVRLSGKVRECEAPPRSMRGYTGTLSPVRYEQTVRSGWAENQCGPHPKVQAVARLLPAVYWRKLTIESKT